MQEIESTYIIKSVSSQNWRHKMMVVIFDWCVNILIYWANIFGITYKEINVWVFVIIWPILTAVMAVIIFRQWRRIRQLSK